MTLFLQIKDYCNFCECISKNNVLLGSSQVSSPQHKPYQLELHPGQHSGNGKRLI